MQIKKRNRKSSRKASRKASRSTRRRMGGEPTVHILLPQPTFDIEFDPDNEVKYQRILNHPDNQFKNRMAPTFADQQMGVYDYVVEFNDDHNATIKQTAGLSDRLNQRLKMLHIVDAINSNRQ